MASDLSTPTSEGKLLLTVDEVAELLGVSRRSVWRLSSGPDLPSPVKLGRSARWRRADIMAYVEDL